MTRAASVLIVILFFAALAEVQHVARFDGARSSFSAVASNVWSIYGATLNGCSEANTLSNATGQAVNSEDSASAGVIAAPMTVSSRGDATPTRPQKALPLLGMAGLGSLVAGFIMRR